MKEINDGGAAFPIAGVRVESGMSLRDYLAAKAMQAYLSSGTQPRDNSQEDYAYTAYLMADAMLAERAK